MYRKLITIQDKLHACVHTLYVVLLIETRDNKPLTQFKEGLLFLCDIIDSLLVKPELPISYTLLCMISFQYTFCFLAHRIN